MATGTGEMNGDYVLKGGWYTLWVTIALSLLASVIRQLLTLAAAPMARSLFLNDSQLGAVQGLAFALFSLFAVYFIAWAADRFDRRIVIGGCLITCSIGTMACGFAQNFEQLFLAAVAIAAGDIGLAPIVTSFAPDLFKGRKRLLANGLIFFCSFLGVSAGLALGGAAFGVLDAVHERLPASMQTFESWRLVFFLAALPMPLLLLLLLFTKLGRSGDSSESQTQNDLSHPFLPFVRHNRHAVATVLGGLGLWALAFTGYLAWLPVAANRLFGTTPAENGTAMGIATAIGVLTGVGTGTFVVRRLIIKQGPVASIRFFWVTMLISLPALLGFLFVREAWQAFVLFGIVMLSSNAIGCMIYTVLQDMAPTSLRARMFGAWVVIYGLVAANAPTFIGWTSSALGQEPRMLLVAISAVAIPSWIAAMALFRMAERSFTGLVRNVAEIEQRESGRLRDSTESSDTRRRAVA